MPYETERRVAVEAVQLACELCVAVQQRLVEGMKLDKVDRSPVTVADFGAQAVISHLLAQAFPNDPLVGEEDAAVLRDDKNRSVRDKVGEAVRAVMPDLVDDAILGAIDRGLYEGGNQGRHWTLDPIDGTKGFLRLDQYAVALALIVDGEVVLGVLGCPSLPHDADQPDGPRGCLFWAVKGEGASWRPVQGGEAQSIGVVPGSTAADARFCESVESAHTNQSHSARVAALLGIDTPAFRIDSQCKYAAVGRGDASIYLRLPTRKDYVEKIWDHAAGYCVVTEAGGRVTDVYGRDLDFGLGRGLRANKGVVVTNGPLHDEVVAAVRQVLGL